MLEYMLSKLFSWQLPQVISVLEFLSHGTYLDHSFFCFFLYSTDLQVLSSIDLSQGKIKGRKEEFKPERTAMLEKVFS